MATKLLIKSPVEHDGKVLAENSTVTIKDDDQAQALILAGSAVEYMAEAKADDAKA
jgi:hypothetical protein